MEDLVSLVIDFGSHSIKAGFGNEGTPSFIIPSIVGKVIGLGIYEDDPELSFVAPFERDKIKSRSAFEDLLEYTVKRLLDLRSLEAKNCSLLITFPLNGSREDRTKLNEILFNKYGFGAIYITSDAAMSLVASGKRTGVVIQMGHEVTSVVAIIDDTPKGVSNSSNRDVHEYEVMHLAGTDISRFLKSEMEKEEVFGKLDFFSPRGQKEADKYKSEYCFFAEDYDKELEKLGNPDRIPEPENPEIQVGEEHLIHTKFPFVKDSPISRRYAPFMQHEETASVPIPKISITDTSARAPTPTHTTTTTQMSFAKNQGVFEGPEGFLQPGILCIDGFGIDSRIYNVIVKVPDISYHGILYNNIVLSGGSAKIRGLRERLLSSVAEFVPRGARLNVSFPHEKEPTESDGGYTSEELENESSLKNPCFGVESLELAAFRGACRLTQLPHYVSLLAANHQYDDSGIIMRNPIRRSIRISRPSSIIQYYD